MHHHWILLSLVSILFYALFNALFQKRIVEHMITTYPGKAEDIRKLTRQCSRWLIAAQQDQSPLIAILHGQYGMGYLWAIKDIATTEEFKEATGLDFLEFEKHATEIQDKVSKRVIKTCPQFSGDIDLYLGRIAGEV